MGDRSVQNVCTIIIIIIIIVIIIIIIKMIMVKYASIMLFCQLIIEYFTLGACPPYILVRSLGRQ